nr:Ig-like domain-containing protein [uncultured Flavobacterium sp.]
MNKDADERLIPDGQYRHAENINVVNSETSQNAGVAKNVLSNKKLTNFNFTGTVYNITPKLLVYEAKNRIYWLCKDDVGCYLLEYNIINKITTPVLVDTRPPSTRVLNLDKNFLITGINLLKTEDESKELLLWTDNNMQPCCVNIKRAKTWAPNSFDEEDILLVKKPPRYPLQTIPTYSVGDSSNNLLDKFPSFAYRYKYQDGEYSAISSYTYYKFFPKSADIDFQTMLNNGMVNQYNAIKLIFNTGDKRVTDIQLIIKQSNSNTLYLIDNFNKKEKGYLDNSSASFVFSNKKILVALPENELYRSFDNIPLKAKGQTLINNFIAYSNYLEFYNIPNKPIYDLSLISKDIRGEQLSKQNISPRLMQINIPSTIVLKKDTSIAINFNLSEDVPTDAGRYNQELTFYLYKDFANASDIAQDPEFISFIEKICTLSFIQNINGVTPPVNSTIDSNTEFSIYEFTPTSITLQAPSIKYLINNTPPVTTRNWNFNFDDTDVTFNAVALNSSLKSNRSYEVGIIYLDKYNRASTVQTYINNTIYIDNEFSTFQNKLKVTIYSIAPSWADRYKLVVKQDKEHYETIFVNSYYREGLFAYVKLEGDNIDKVKKGDTLVVKSDSNGPLEQLITTEVLEIETKKLDFIEGNQTADDTNIIEESGLYMKIKPTNFNMEFDDSKARTFQGSSHLRYPGRTYTSPKFGELNKATIPVYENYKIFPGTTIKIHIEFSAKGAIAYKQVYDKKFISAGEYNSLKEWFEVEVKNIGSFGKDYTWDGVADIGSNIKDGFGAADQWRENSGWGWSPDGSSFFVVPHRKGTTTRDISTNVKFEVIFTEGIVIFETQQKNVDNNVFYETEETFDVVNGQHQGSVLYPILQDQNNATPAVIELDFFNCFVQGQGIESYKYKDKFNANALAIDYRPTSASIEPYKQIRRFADITHSSEPYNESSNINGLNNFNLATANFKELDKQYGSVQLLHNRLGDILVLQEEKAGYVLFGKEAIYTEQGEPIITKISEVLGTYKEYQGNNGIGLNPESFDQDNFRFYWFNPYYGTPIRLSVDGTTEINEGMQTYFRNNSIAFKNSKKIGAFDSFNKLYTLSLEQNNTVVDVFDCGNTFQKVITNTYQYILKLNDQTGTITLNYNVLSGNINVKTIFNNTEQLRNITTGSGTISIVRDTLDANELIVELTPNNNTSIHEIAITNVCPIATPLDVVLVVLSDELDAEKTIQNRFRSGLNNFLQYEDTFLPTPITKFETLNGFEGKNLFPKQGDTVTIQSVKRQLHTANFLAQECNQIKYLISNQNYNTSNVLNLLNDATNLILAETVQGINQNTFTGNFEFNRTEPDEILYLIWDYTNRKPILTNDNVTLNSGATTVINVLLNDQAVGTPIVTIITAPINGTAVVNLDNTITYTHNGTATISDSITYQVSNGVCSSSATINISATLPTIACSASASSGGEGVTEYTIALENPLGGIVIMDFNAQGVVDKLEIIHNGVKKATSGMTTANSGPFDNLYGNPTVPTGAEATATDQFIGTSKGTVPTRDSVFLSETGITDVTRTKQQLIWFVYTAADYNTTNSVIVRVTGPSGTGWDLIRLCTNQTPLGIS